MRYRSWFLAYARCRSTLFYSNTIIGVFDLFVPLIFLLATAVVDSVVATINVGRCGRNITNIAALSFLFLFGFFLFGRWLCFMVHDSIPFIVRLLH